MARHRRGEWDPFFCLNLFYHSRLVVTTLNKKVLFGSEKMWHNIDVYPEHSGHFWISCANLVIITEGC